MVQPDSTPKGFIFSWRAPLLIIALVAALGMIDSFYLVLQYIAAATSKGAPTPCSASQIVNCTKTVQGTWGHLLGPPNPMFGMFWYSGCFLYGVTRCLGSSFTQAARRFVGAIIMLGIVFSYVLYLASLLSLRGVCPFCLASTTFSTIILLGFVVDDVRQENPIVSRNFHPLVTAVQILTTLLFVVGLPLFLAINIPLLVDPIQALMHWSFPTMVLLVVCMAVAQLWAFYMLRKL